MKILPHTGKHFQYEDVKKFQVLNKKRKLITKFPIKYNLLICPTYKFSQSSILLMYFYQIKSTFLLFSTTIKDYF